MSNKPAMEIKINLEQREVDEIASFIKHSSSDKLQRNKSSKHNEMQRRHADNVLLSLVVSA